MKSINVNIYRDPISYGIDIGQNIISKSLELSLLEKKYSSVLIIYDSMVRLEFIEKIQKVSSKFTKNTNKISLEVSKNSKSIESFLNICKYMITNSYNRDSLIISCGGGTIGDLSGYVASSYNRGIDYIQVPSTFLAMIDSSIGGKTAIDTNYGKNLIGSFYHPIKTIIDTDILISLDKKEINSALFEVVKYAILFSENFLNYLETNLHELDNKIILHNIIEKCCKMKSELVSQDEFDRSLRMNLNFGHTVGHAIESIYGISHGEAIGYGIKCALYISQKVGGLSKSEYKRILDLLQRLTLPSIKLNSSEIINMIKRDKKVQNNINKFILVNKIASPYISSDINQDLVIESIKQL